MPVVLCSNVGLSDPFVVCTLGRQQQKTKVIDNNLNPVWNQMLLLSWDGISPLHLQVIDKDYLKSDGKKTVLSFEIILIFVVIRE